MLMYDSVTIGNIPSNAKAVAGYVNGQWPTYPGLKKAFPRALKLSVAVSADVNADALDIEKGDATVSEAPTWFHRQTVKRPCFYCDLATAPELYKTLTMYGIHREDYRLLIAHWTGVPHLCGPRCSTNLHTWADATQFSNRPDYDVSFLSGDFFPLHKRVEHRLVSWLHFGHI